MRSRCPLETRPEATAAEPGARGGGSCSARFGWRGLRADLPPRQAPAPAAQSPPRAAPGARPASTAGRRLHAQPPPARSRCPRRRRSADFTGKGWSPGYRAARGRGEPGGGSAPCPSCDFSSCPPSLRPPPVSRFPEARPVLDR